MTDSGEKNYYELHKHSILQEYKRNRYSRILYNKQRYIDHTKDWRSAQLKNYYDRKFTYSVRTRYVENKFKRQKEEIEHNRLKWLQENNGGA